MIFGGEAYRELIRLARVGRSLVQILLKSYEDLAYLFRLAEVRNGIGDGVAILQAEQRS